VCGITGMWRREPGQTQEQLHEAARAQADAIRARGPDDHGTWVDATQGIAFGHRRLSIVDLSPAGHQPMASADARWIIAFNGEIYNHAAIRAELDGQCATSWRGGSDTEVILAAVQLWGVHEAVRRCVGMFAIALWDRDERQLWLVRDRLGIKPLYYASTRQGLVFASELKSFRVLPEFDATIDADAISYFLRRGYVSAPATIYRHAWKVPAGTIFRICAPRLSAIESHTFWSAEHVARHGAEMPFTGNDAEATESLDRLLRDSIRLRMLADVPLGAFLSGGVDSSTVVALMQAQSSRPIKTFSIGNENTRYDESGSAEAVARHLGTDHTAFVVSPADALATIPELPDIYDEPFADSSQIPTYLVSRLARRDVTVALSGDGGDELFGGYERHLWARRLRTAQRLIPRAALWLGGALVGGAGTDRLDLLFDRVPGAARWVGLPGRKLHKLSEVVRTRGESELYFALSGLWQEPPLLGAAPPALGEPRGWHPQDFRAQIMLEDLRGYLADDILVKVDRASMAVSLEARVPILDHRVVEFAWRLPMHMKIRGMTSKWILRQVLARYVPAALVNRPKMGFGVPLGAWLRGPLRGWAEELLDPYRMRDAGHLDGARVRRMWAAHLRGENADEYRLWAVLMFQAWLERQHV
jgi:asparagine synthase (glutamine-hydrolysing)